MERDYYTEGWIDGYKRGADDERPKAFSDGYEKGYQQGKADERNNVLSLLKKLIVSDYNSRNCELLFVDLCESILEELKEKKNE